MDQIICGQWSVETKTQWNRDTSHWKDEASRPRNTAGGGNVIALLREAVLRLHNTEAAKSLMHACWLLLAASGEIPAIILQSTPPEFVPEGRSLVKEIDFHQKDFPVITRPLDAPETAEDDETSVIAACHELGIVGEDPAFRKALQEAFIYSQYDDFHVLLHGETGSGKEYFAQFIHHLGTRAIRPMITVNCSSIPENLVESQLFGHKKGAFTGASTDHEGKFKSADRGILFLDEIGELPLPAQAKLLRALDQREIKPVGSSRPVKVNVRVIAATHRNLREMVLAGTFREDLYQRFGSSIAIPPLRSRKVDIPILSGHMLTAWNARHQHQKRLPLALHRRKAHHHVFAG